MVQCKPYLEREIMFFELIGGSHEQDNKKFMKGDIIETDVNLVSLFRGKFKKVSKEGGIPAPERVPNIPTKMSPPHPKGSEAGDGKPASDSVKTITTRLGPDVTTAFLEAKGTEFKIHKAADNMYHIVDGNSDIIGGAGFTRNEVLIYLNNA